jgi:hypothetical protein
MTFKFKEQANFVEACDKHRIGAMLAVVIIIACGVAAASVRGAISFNV